MKHFVVVITLLITSVVNGQLNADQKFIRNHKIQTAKFYTGSTIGFHTFYYDREGRLYKDHFSSWDGGYYEPTGYVSITEYDTLGRKISIHDYYVVDSLELSSERIPAKLTGTVRFNYPNDSTVVEIDTAWNQYGQIERILVENTRSHWTHTPCPHKKHPVFWPEYILADQISTNHRTFYLYPDTISKTPTDIREVIWLSMSASTIDENSIKSEFLADCYRNDSAFHSRSFHLRTLHGDKDTVTITEYRNANRMQDESNVYAGKPNILHGYVVSKRWLGKYHVRYNIYATPRSKWNKVTLKEPWNDYRFNYLEGPFSSWPPSKYNTIENYEGRYSTKPVYTYY